MNFPSNQPQPIMTFSREPVYNGAKYLFDRYSYQIEGQYIVEVEEKGQSNFDPMTIINQFNDLMANGECAGCGNCVISNVSIPSNKGYGIIPYVIQYECFNFGQGDTSAVIDIKNEVSTSFSEDGTLQVNHNVEAKAISKDGISITNLPSAIANSIRSLNFPGVFVDGVSISREQMLLVNSKDTTDLANQTISLNRQYTSNYIEYSSRLPLFRINWSKQESLEGNSTISINGQVILGSALSQQQLIDIPFLRSIAPNNLFPDATYKLINGNVKKNTANATAEIQAVFSNDQRINTQGALQEQSLNINSDFVNQSFKIGYTSSAKNITSNPGTDLRVLSESSTILSTIGINLNNFVLESKGDGKATNMDTYQTESYIKAKDIIGGSLTSSPDFYNVNASISVDFGLPQASYTPILNGRGNYYIEDLDFMTRTKINGRITALSSPKIEKPIDRLKDKLLSYIKAIGFSDAIVLKDTSTIDTYYTNNKKVFSYSLEFEVSIRDDSFRGRIGK